MVCNASLVPFVKLSATAKALFSILYPCNLVAIVTQKFELKECVGVRTALRTQSYRVSPSSTYRIEVCKTRGKVFKGFTWCWRWGERVFTTKRVPRALFTLKWVNVVTPKWLEGVTGFGMVAGTGYAHRCALTCGHEKTLKKWRQKYHCKSRRLWLKRCHNISIFSILSHQICGIF